MKLIKPYIEVYYDLQPEEMMKKVEMCGRVCYKSEARITEGSAEKFIANLIKRGHEAVLEHASITVKFVTDRGISHEIVRHRVMSFAQESTRYCNYGKDKFGNEVTFIKPTWYNMVTDEQRNAFDDFLSISEESYMALLDKWENRTPDKRYKTKFKGNPLTPQQARQVLPNALKTEIVVTGFESDWEHFFSLRSPKYGAQGVHPDMAKLADELYEKLNSVNN